MSKELQGSPRVEEIKEIPIEKIRIDNQMVRSEMDDDHISELSLSISTHGLLQPIIVSKIEKEDAYQLLAGAHRLAAVKRLGWKRVLAKITKTPKSIKSIALLENIVRKDMSLEEEIEAVRMLYEDDNLSVSQICEITSKNRDWVNRRIAAAHFPNDLKNDLFEGRLPLWAAEILSTIEDEGARAYCLSIYYQQRPTKNELLSITELFKNVPSFSAAVEEGIKKAKEVQKEKGPLATCDWCGTKKPLHIMYLSRMCPDCKRIISEAWENSFSSEEEPEEYTEIPRKEELN
ncbi:MAG: ParB/RepB/Spo0J family partition protein [Thermodesulfobacteriota bacterium]